MTASPPQGWVGRRPTGPDGMQAIWDACARWDSDYNLPLQRRRTEQHERTEADSEKAQEAQT